jgi:hypothetical protein
VEAESTKEAKLKFIVEEFVSVADNAARLLFQAVEFTFC